MSDMNLVNPPPGSMTPEEVREWWAGRQQRVTPAEEVIDTQRRVMEGLDTPLVQQYVFQFMKSVTDKAYDEGGIEDVTRAMSALFWPASNEKMLCGLLRKELFTARTYQVTGEMVEAVTGTYVNSSNQIGKIVQEEMPSESGFVWLDIPFLSSDTHGRLVGNRAVSWSPVTIQYPRFKWANNTSKYSPETHPDYFDPWPGLRLNSWFSPTDRDSYWSPQQEKDWEFLGQPLLMAHTSTMPIGARFGGHPKHNFDMTPDDFMHWVHVLWMFMESEITVTHQPHLQRNFHRRAMRSLKQPPAVNIIMLRRVMSSHDPDQEHESHHIDWTCQWVVQGHHRHLDKYEGPRHHATPDSINRGVCAVCQRRITWVKAHIKGPEGLPLRSADQLYRLAR